MLVLSRRLREELFIGDDVVITVLEVNGNRVRLGISAPRNVRVDRKEVRLRQEAAEESSKPNQ